MSEWRSPEGGPLIDASAPRPARIRRTSRDERRVVGLLALAGAVAAILGGASPTGIVLVDFAYVGGAGATLVLAGGRSRRVAWLLSGVLALWFTPTTLGRVAAVIAVLVAIHAVRRGRGRALGAVVGALLALVLGDLGAGGFTGATMLWATVAAAPMLVSGAWLMPSGRRRPIAVGVGMWAAAATVATLAFGLGSLLAIGDVTDGTQAVTDGFDLASDGEQKGAATAFESARSSFDSARTKVSGFWTLPARLVPVVGQQVRAVQIVAGEGVALTETAADTARSVDPDDLRLVDGSIDLGIIEALQPVLDRGERALQRAHDRVSEARSPWLAGPLDRRLGELLDELERAQPSARTASAAVRELPEMLGADGPVNWLVALTTPAEARGLGGILGNWALVEADSGRIRILQTGRNEDVNRSLRAREIDLAGPDQYVERWGPFMPNRFFQDVTLSPDLPMVAEVTADLFERATDQPVDGVIFVDPYAVAAILRITGPVAADDSISLTHRTVVPFLLEGQYIEYEGDESARVRALSRLVQGAFDGLTSGELPGPDAIADIVGPVVEQDRLGVWWSRADDDAELIDAAGLDSRFPVATRAGHDRGTDMVALVHQNAGQNKLDTHLRRELDYRLVVDDGIGDGTITVTLHNDLADLTLPAAIIANNDQGYPLGTNVARLTVHTALTFQSASVDGEEIVVDRRLAFGHDAITALIEVPPGGSRTFVLRVRGEVDSDPYVLSLPHQPLVNDDSVTLSVTVGGERLEIVSALTLSADTIVTERN